MRLTQVPKIDCTTSIKAGKTIGRVHVWLLENAVLQAEALNDEWVSSMFSKWEAKRLTDADVETLNDWLFDPEFGQGNRA